MTRICAIRRIGAAKNPFVFNDRQFGFANFSKFFLGRNLGNQNVVGEKIWIRDFSGLAALFRASAPRTAANKKP
jgi:hypothetical protein